MIRLWQRRLWTIGAVLLAVVLALLGLAAVLWFAGDEAGEQFALGVAVFAGLGFVADLLVFVVYSRTTPSPD